MACKFPNLIQEETENDAVDTVPGDYLDWARTTLTGFENQHWSATGTFNKPAATTWLSELYKVLCAYVFSNDDIRAKYTKVGGLKIVVAAKYGEMVYGCLQHISTLTSFLQHCIKDVTYNLAAWVDLFSKMTHIKHYTCANNPVNFEFSHQSQGWIPWLLGKEHVIEHNDVSCTVSFNSGEGKIGDSVDYGDNLQAITALCNKIRGVSKAFRVVNPIGVTLWPGQTVPDVPIWMSGLQTPENFDVSRWFLQCYFSPLSAQYSRFLPPFQLCKEFVAKLCTHCEMNAAQTDSWIKSLSELVSNTTVINLITDNKLVWNSRKHQVYHVKSKHEGKSSIFEYNRNTVEDADTTDLRVLVKSPKLLVPGVVVTKETTSGVNETMLMEAQCVLIRVLYLFNTLLYYCDNQETISKLEVALQKVAQRPESVYDGLRSTPEISEDDLKSFTQLELSVPRINPTLLNNVYIFPSEGPPPRPPSYILPLQTFGLRLLQARSVNQVDEIVLEMKAGPKSVENLISREKALNVASVTVKETTDAIDELCKALWTSQQFNKDEHKLDRTKVKTFGETASKYKHPDTNTRVAGSLLTFAQRVIQTCCQAFNVECVDNDSTLGITTVRYSEAQMFGFGGFPGRTGRFIESKAHEQNHKVYQEAVQLLYGDQIARCFTTYGYVLWVVRWLMGVVAAIGQFGEGNQYLNCAIHGQSDNNVAITFGIQDVPQIGIQDSKTSCEEHAKWFRYKETAEKPNEVKSLTLGDLPFVMEYQHGEHATNYYYVCKYNLPVQMTPGFKASQAKPWLDKIGLLDTIMYRLDSLGASAQHGSGEAVSQSGLGVTPQIHNIRTFLLPGPVSTPDQYELKACYDMMDIPSFSSNFEALPIVEHYYDYIEHKTNPTLTGMIKEASTHISNTVTQVKQSLQSNNGVDSSNKEKYKTRFVQHILLWMLTGNYALPLVGVDKDFELEKAQRLLKQQQPIQGGLAPLNVTRNMDDVPEVTFTRYHVKRLDKVDNTKFTIYYLRMAKPLFTNLMGLLLGKLNFLPKDAIHVLYMYWNYRAKNDSDGKEFETKLKNTTFDVDLSQVGTNLGLWLGQTTKAQPTQRVENAKQVVQPNTEQVKLQESAWLKEKRAPPSIKDRRTWENIQKYGFEILYLELSNDPNLTLDFKKALLGHIRDAAHNNPPFAYNKSKPTTYDPFFANYPNLFYPFGDRWHFARSKEAQEHAAKKGGNLGQNFNNQGYNQGLNQGLNQGGIGAIPGAGLAGLGAAAMYGQSAFHHGNRNILQQPNQQQQQQARGQVTFSNHTTQGQIVHATVNTASEVQDDADKRIKRVYADKLSNRARNLTFTDSQGRSVFTLLPHNILAIVLLLIYAVMTIYASSIGTSTYTLLNSVNKQDSSYAANLPLLQKPRMACSTFFGIGVGMVVAFVVSLVEIVNNTRLRQALFIVLMAAPIIVLGVMGVSGASDVCGTNSMTDTTNPTVNTTNTTINFASTNDLTASSQRLSPVGQKRKRGTFEQKMPRVANFFKSVLGTHDSDLDGSAMLGDAPSCTPGGGPNVCSGDMKTSCTKDTQAKDCASGVCLTGTCNNDPSAPCATALDCIDDVTRNNMKASDFFFIGIGMGVLLAGLCTLMPGNPFHPDVHDTMHGLLKQKDFSVSSQIKKHWLIYFGLFSLVLLGGAASSLWLGSATPLAKTEDAKAGETIQGPANAQAGVMIGISVVIFCAIALGGYLHRKRHTKLALEVKSSGILHGHATASTVELGQAPARK